MIVLMRTLLLLMCLGSVGLQMAFAQQQVAVSRLFERLKPQFKYYNATVFNQPIIRRLGKNTYTGFVKADIKDYPMLFGQSELINPYEDERVFYYAYNETPGDYYQIVVGIWGDYSPSLVLLNYSLTGQLVHEMNIAGNFADAGEAYLWQSELKTSSTLNFNYNSYYEKDDSTFYCDSTVLRYLIAPTGQLSEVAKQIFTVATRSIGGPHVAMIARKDDLLNVFAPSGLKVKSRPSMRRTRTMGILPYGAQVEVVDTTDQELLVDWINARWVEVKYQGESGYIFSGYLSRLPVPPTEPDSCYHDYSRLLREYVLTHFVRQGRPDTLRVAPQEAREDHVRVMQALEGGYELISHSYRGGNSTELILPDSQLEEAFILMSALLNNCLDDDLLWDNLLFVKNRSKEIYKIYDRTGYVAITQNSEDKISLEMKTVTAGRP
jgi:hypothetical protein